jgi:DNA binding domain, excisionase family
VTKADETYISTTQAAEILGVTRQRVLQLIEQGRLQATKVANVYLIRKTDISAVAERKPGRPAKKEGKSRQVAKKALHKKKT